MSSPIVLVTGASGFIGAHVVLQSLEKGFKVRGTVRDPSNEKKTAFLRNLPGAADRLELVALDLENCSDAQFEAVVSGCTFIHHVASPFPLDNPKDENVLIKPAVRGTTAVLEAAKKVGGVKRIVITSSVVSVSEGYPKERYSEPFTEADWSIIEGPSVNAYTKSKVMAEKAAWEFMEREKANVEFDIVTVNPSLVVGPALSDTLGSSNEVIKKVFNRELPAIPSVGFCVVDVRDVAKCHLLAMEHEKAGGNRFICSERFMWFKEIGQLLYDEFHPLGYSPAKTSLPYAAVWLFSWFDGSLKYILSKWGLIIDIKGTKAETELGLEYSGLKQALFDTAKCLVHYGHVKKTSKYTDDFDAVKISSGW